MTPEVGLEPNEGRDGVRGEREREHVVTRHTHVRYLQQRNSVTGKSNDLLQREHWGAKQRKNLGKDPFSILRSE